MGEPAAVEAVNEEGTSRYVLTCEHASSFIPESYGGLGLPDSELSRHIAWDIGAAAVARILSPLIDAPLFLSGYSRLLIDCNRPIGTETSIPTVSETTDIPGNANLTEQESRSRADAFYWPFQKAIAAHLDRRRSQGRPAVVLGIHSFTPFFKGFVRPWHAGILFRKSRAFGEALVSALAEPGLVVAANEPYTIDDEGDYTVPVHGEARGLDAALVEIRQDLIADEAGAAQWAHRLAAALRHIG
jgi:predicted N-formylglutamate amidohydrolase